MTTEYQGNGIYKFSLGHNIFILNTEEIVEIANYAHENDFETTRAEEEETYIESLEKNVDELTQSNKDWEFEVIEVRKYIDNILNDKG